MRRFLLRKPILIIASALAMLASGTGISYAAGAFGTTLGDNLIGKQQDGSYLTQTNQYVTPAGDVITEDGRPFGLALNPDGKTAAALNTGGGTSGIVTVFDLVNHKVLQQTGSGNIANGGVLYSPDGSHLWVAQTTDLVGYTVGADGTLSNPVKVSLPGVSRRAAVPAGLAWAPGGTDLLVTLSANNTLGVVDTSTDTLVKQIPVGNAPNSVAVIGGDAYVSNQGGRPAQSGDQTDNSYGTQIVTQGGDEVPSSGTVSEVDLGSGTQTRTFNVGLEPSALLADGTNLIVANNDSDSVTTIDTAKQQVGRTFSADPAPGAPYGSQPDGLAMLDPGHLAVSLGRYNAVAVYNYSGAYSAPSFDGLIPAGSFPSGVAEDPQLGRLVIASEQGLGSVGPAGTVGEGTGTSPATGHLGYNFAGTVQLVAPPNQGQMQAYTEKVFQDNQWNGMIQRNASGSSNVKPVAVPLHIGQPSTIKHVFLIVKENRTYDQVLGDDPRGNGDASYAQFGQKVTPNTHALANTFPLIDNLYSDGTNSAEGHNWLMQGFVNNYMQQMYGNYTRSYGGSDPLINNPTGFIWDDALKHGKTVTDWGEYAQGYVNSSGQGAPADWQKWYHDSQVLEGKASGPLNYPIGEYQPTSDLPSLQKILQPNFPNFNTNIPDQYRADLFQRDFGNYVKNGNLPALSLMWLMDDHTDGTSPGALAPEAEVADNDLALGRIVGTITHSTYWKDSAIFVVEDDSQNGVDHVDGHRNVALAISPYAKRGYVDNSYYSQLNMMRTIEQILGIPPMNAEDLAAEPMYNSFTNTPDYTPYTYLPNQIPITETNPPPTCPAPPHFDNLVPQSQMTATATSYQPGYEPSKAIDGNCSTFWHTEYSPVMAQLPQSITLDLGGTYNTNGLTYVPRQDGNSNGFITGYTISVSSDGQTFTNVTSGTWSDDPSAKAATWSATPARYVRLEATSGHGGFASADEMDVAYASSSTQAAGQVGSSAQAMQTVQAAWNRWSLQAAWAKWSAQQDYSQEDMVNMAQENRDIWYSTSGFAIPYPGDSQVLYPNQVPGGSTKPTPAGNGDS